MCGPLEKSGSLVKTCLALQHVAFEDLGLLEPLLTARGFEIQYMDMAIADLSQRDPLAPDLLVVLGGPLGAYEDDLYPFLKAEIEFIRRRLDQKLPTLGVCFGSQLMARALGARVYKGAAKEIGWKTLNAVGNGGCLAPVLEADLPVLHWHGDTFDLPDGAELLASTELYPNQAFAVGSHALALQFHLEVDGGRIEQWLVGHACEISITEGVSVPNLRADTERSAPALTSAAEQVFGKWLDGAGFR